MPKRHTIVIKQNGYVPNSVHVDLGDEVVWDNQDAHHHTATGMPGSFFFDTGEIAGRTQSRAITFDRGSGPSGFEYYCTLHDFMTGRMFVLPASAAPAAKPAAPAALGPTYDLATWQTIARHVAAHWVEDMADNFAFALRIHRDADLERIKAEWDQIEASWQSKTGTTKTIVNRDAAFNITNSVDPSAFNTARARRSRILAAKFAALP